jgi:hypothetical protein
MLAVGAPRTASSYLHFRSSVSSSETPYRWVAFPVRYLVTQRDIPLVSAQELQRSVDRCAGAWAATEGASVSLAFERFTQAFPQRGDRVTTIAFEELGGGVLGVTRLLVDTRTNEMIEADIAMASLVPWTVNPPEADRQDMIATLTHEIGHLLGLGHSAVGETQMVTGGRRVIGSETIMFPISFSRGTVGRAIRADDQAGLRVLYPSGALNGKLSGRVTLNGRGVQGAHVVVFDLATQELVAGFTLNSNGEFSIGGLRGGAKLIRVEPLDDANFDSFFAPAFRVETGFAVTFFEELVFVPPNGASPPVTIEATPR